LEDKPPDDNDKIIAGRYRVTGQIGAGGMGIICKGVDMRVADKQVAIKLLNSPAINNDILVRFQLEAKAASQLSHKNLIAIYDFGLTDDRIPYMVMELVQGKTLSRILKQQKRLTLEQSVSIVKQICSAMSHVHKNGIVHRDLKTSNIMIVDSTDGVMHPKVLDFGIAKLTGQDAHALTRSGLVVGTVNYMSPEQASGSKVDHRSDIYSLGCVLYELLTGTQPFSAETFLETLSMHLNDPAPSLAEKAPDVKFPVAIEKAVQKALALSALPDHGRFCRGAFD